MPQENEGNIFDKPLQEIKKEVEGVMSAVHALKETNDQNIKKSDALNEKKMDAIQKDILDKVEKFQKDTVEIQERQKKMEAALNRGERSGEAAADLGRGRRSLRAEPESVL